MNSAINKNNRALTATTPALVKTLSVDFTLVIR